MADKTYKFDVTMTCGGCTGAVDRALSKLSGVKAQVKLGEPVVVTDIGGQVGADAVLAKIQKTGKKVNKWDTGDGWQEIPAAA